MSTSIDDIEVVRLCNPLAAAGAVQTVSESFLFAEGPRWRAGELLVSDIDADTIWTLAPPSTLTIHRTPSDHANGLATDVAGDLLAAEHATRRVSREDGGGVVTTVVDTYLGQRFNSPNDIAVRSDGTIYFTDPDFGLAVPGDRELAFNGLFRRAPDGTLAVEWAGTLGANEPNGVALSPDEGTLYATDTQAGELLAWSVASDGSLFAPRVVASGSNTPDGLCIDSLGNLYVATWASSVEVYAPDGTRWGRIAIPRAATNCGFGGNALTSLYVTAHEGLYRIDGLPVGMP